MSHSVLTQTDAKGSSMCSVCVCVTSVVTRCGVLCIKVYLNMKDCDTRQGKRNP